MVCFLCRSLPENGTPELPEIDETTLLHSLHKAGKQAKSAVKHVGLQSPGTSLTRHAGTGRASLLKSEHIPCTPGVASSSAVIAASLVLVSGTGTLCMAFVPLVPRAQALAWCLDVASMVHEQPCMSYAWR